MDASLIVSSTPGAGSTFSFTIALEPVSHDVNSPETATPISAQTPGPSPETPLLRDLGTILVAEDNPVNRKVASTMLWQRGYKVIEAVNGAEAVRITAEQKPDAVFMDIQMPVMDGLEAAGLIRKNEATNGVHTPIIAMTAHAMKGDRQRCLDAGMDDYVSKPMEPQALTDILARLAINTPHTGDTAPIPPVVRSGFQS
jgi:CheY-like chemotaxis protein